MSPGKILGNSIWGCNPRVRKGGVGGSHSPVATTSTHDFYSRRGSLGTSRRWDLFDGHTCTADYDSASP